MKELICYEVARCPEAGANLQVNEKNSFTHPSSCILPSFSQNTSELLLPKRLWKFESTISFWKCKWKVVLLVIYLFNYDSSKSIFFMLNYGITFSWGFSWVQFLSNKLEFFVSCNNIKGYKEKLYKDYKNILFALCFNMYFFLKKINFFKKKKLFSIMVIIIFYFDICVKVALSTTISAMKKW